MRYIKLFEEYTSSKKGVGLILPKNTLLFHGTIEEYDYKNIRPGGYDEIFWTCQQSGIAQLYIPVSGSALYTNLDALIDMRRYEDNKKILNQLGIIYTDYEKDGNNYSYKEADIFNEYSELCEKIDAEVYELHKKLDEYKKKERELYNNHHDVDMDEFFKQYLELETEYEEKMKYSREHNLSKYKKDYIKNKLAELGYDPDDRGIYKLKMNDGYIIPFNENTTGKLLIMHTLRDFKILDITFGETRESDLTDLDYHDIELFRYAENNGYDGIKITDFAQSETHGNVGHYSIGLFRKTLKDLDIETIDAVHPNQIKRDSIEYLEYKKRSN